MDTCSTCEHWNVDPAMPNIGGCVRIEWSGGDNDAKAWILSEEGEEAPTLRTFATFGCTEHTLATVEVLEVQDFYTGEVVRTVPIA
jgi:hypothetical protein